MDTAIKKAYDKVVFVLPDKEFANVSLLSRMTTLCIRGD
jgi:hypothetical protein